MDVGMVLPTFAAHAGREPVVRLAKAIERSGFDSLWVSEHLVAPPDFFHPYGESLDALGTLGFLTAITERVHLGTSVLILPLHEPVSLAKRVATAQALSGGRVQLGVGAGWLEPEFMLIGVDFRHRGELTDRHLAMLRHLLSPAPEHSPDPPPGWEGVSFAPACEVSVPILVGGVSPQALHRAASAGDGWQGVWLEPEELPARIEATRGRSRKADFRISLRIDLRLLPEGQRLRHGLVGPVSAVIERMRSYRDLGVDELIIDPMDRDHGDVPDLAGLLELIHRVRDEILPALT